MVVMVVVELEGGCRIVVVRVVSRRGFRIWRMGESPKVGQQEQQFAVNLHNLRSIRFTN